MGSSAIPPPPHFPFDVSALWLLGRPISAFTCWAGLPCPPLPPPKAKGEEQCFPGGSDDAGKGSG